MDDERRQSPQNIEPHVTQFIPISCSVWHQTKVIASAVVHSSVKTQIGLLYNEDIYLHKKHPLNCVPHVCRPQVLPPPQYQKHNKHPDNKRGTANAAVELQHNNVQLNVERTRRFFSWLKIRRGWNLIVKCR